MNKTCLFLSFSLSLSLSLSLPFILAHFVSLWHTLYRSMYQCICSPDSNSNNYSFEKTRTLLLSIRFLIQFLIHYSMTATNIPFSFTILLQNSDLSIYICFEIGFSHSSSAIPRNYWACLINILPLTAWSHVKFMTYGTGIQYPFPWASFRGVASACMRRW